MMDLIRNLVSFLIQLKKRKILRRYSLISKSVINRGINLRIDIPTKRKYLKIDDNSIVSGNFIFESSQGFVSIGKHCKIGGGTYICRTNIAIGDNVNISWGG